MSDYNNAIYFAKVKMTLSSNPKAYDSPKYVLCGKLYSKEKKGLFDFIIENEEKKKICCKLANNALAALSFFKEGDEVCAIAAHVENGPIWVFAMEKAKNKCLLSEICDDVNEYGNNYKAALEGDKANSREEAKKLQDRFPSSFHSLPKEFKQNVMEQLSAETCGEVKQRNYNDNLAQLKIKYEICRSTYPVTTQKAVDRLFSNATSDPKRNQKNKDMLIHILNINSAYLPELVTAEEMKACLDKAVYGLDLVKKEVISAIQFSLQMKSKHGLKILLVGPPGTGKTLIAKTIAECRGKPYAFISCSNITSVVDIAGDSSIYDAAKPGRMCEAFFECGTVDSTIILDEMCKMSHGNSKDGDPDSVFTDMLGNGFYYDVNLECEFKTTDTWFIATANYEEDIAPHILNRFDTVIHVPSYTNDQLFHIAKEYIIPSLCKQFEMETCRFLDDNGINYVIENYCNDAGCRRLNSCLRKLFMKAIENYCHVGDGIILSEKDIDLFLEKVNLLNDPANVYYFYKNKFALDDQYLIEKMILDQKFNKISRFSDNADKEKATEDINVIAGYCRDRNIPKSFDYSDFITRLNASHSGMKNVKKVLARSVNNLFRTGNGANILLVGPPGCGKTSILKSAALATGLPFKKISCNGIASKDFIKGTPKQFSNGTWGEIANTVSYTGDTAIIMLDEIDKIDVNGPNGFAILSSFLDMLDEKQFQDVYLGIKFNLKKIIFVATANRLSGLSPELIDRFEIVRVEGYTKKEKKNIFSSHILPEVLRSFNCSCNDIISEEVVDFIIDNYTDSAGARDLKKNAEKVIGDALLYSVSPNITIENVIDSLGRPVHRRENKPDLYVPGVVNGISVNSYSGRGNVFAITAIRSKEDKITGLAQGSLKESVEIAKAVAASYEPNCEDSHYHINFAEGGVKKDGPSAGVAITLAILSCERNEKLNCRFAYTGEIDLHGNIWAIGGTVAKIEAAIESGCKKVFIPAENYNELEEKHRMEFRKNIDVVPVTNISEIISIVFGKSKSKQHKESAYGK